VSGAGGVFSPGKSYVESKRLTVLELGKLDDAETPANQIDPSVPFQDRRQFIVGDARNEVIAVFHFEIRSQVSIPDGSAYFVDSAFRQDVIDRLVG
jgi:hypothetical protein